MPLRFFNSLNKNRRHRNAIERIEAKIGDTAPKYDLSSIPPVPVPPFAPTAPLSTSSKRGSVTAGEITWYQGWDEEWQAFYWYNTKDNASTWFEPHAPYYLCESADRTICPEIDPEEEIYRTVRTGTKDRHFLSTFASLNRHAFRDGSSKALSWGKRKTERLDDQIQVLMEATGCTSRAEAAGALTTSKKNMNVAAEILLSLKKQSNASTLPDTRTRGIDEREMPSEDSIAVCFVCPITLQRFREPVIAADGHSYERTAIQIWLNISQTSPVTNEKLSNKTLTPNYALKSIIRSYLS